jgi:lysozyme
MNDFLPSQDLHAAIRQFEGLRLRLYTDAAGYPTIGYGHWIPRGVQAPETCTLEQAEAWLEQDANVACQRVRQLVTVPMTQAQCDALTDFVYNFGGTALANSTMLRYVNAGDWQSAAQQCLLWNHAHVNGQLVVLTGLTVRRQWEAARMLQDAQPQAQPLPNAQPKQPAPEGLIAQAENFIHQVL